MPNTREKLIELHRTALSKYYFVDHSHEAIVDDLIANDVVLVVRCKDCKYQRKVWHPDRRMISKGYYYYQCVRNDDKFVSHTVTGCDHEFCPYGERKDNEEIQGFE